MATGATFVGTEEAIDKLGSCGRAGTPNQVRLIEFAGNPITEPGVPGELYVRWDVITPGYWDLQGRRLSSEAVIPHR